MPCYCELAGVFASKQIHPRGRPRRGADGSLVERWLPCSHPLGKLSWGRHGLQHCTEQAGVTHPDLISLSGKHTPGCPVLPGAQQAHQRCAQVDSSQGEEEGALSQSELRMAKGQLDRAYAEQDKLKQQLSAMHSRPKQVRRQSDVAT